MACWGVEEEDGYIGRGQTSPPEGERFVSITSGWSHACGLKEDGTAVCWGPEPYATGLGGWDETPDERFAWIDAGNGYTCGQVLDRTRIECWGGYSDVVTSPSPYPYSAQFIDFSGGGRHSCGLWTNGTAVCKGILAGMALQDVAMGPRRFASISSGWDHACGIEIGGVNVVCWGNDDYGQSSSSRGERLEGPEDFPEQASGPDAPLITVSSGLVHACGLTSNGTVWCWGVNEDGRASPPPGRYLAVSSGYQHACGIRRGGSVACWGDNGSGQAFPPESGTFIAISSGAGHTCALREDGAAVCWGSDNSGESSPPEGETFASISSGSSHTCALREDGTPICWGDAFGAEAPPEEETFKAISSGFGYTCALREDGSPVCWGADSNGQASPPDGERFVAISTSLNPFGLGAFTCALREDGSPTCWGHDSPVFGSGPGSPPPGETFVAITVGGYHSCGIRADGSHRCWRFGPSEGEQTSLRASAARASSHSAAGALQRLVWAIGTPAPWKRADPLPAGGSMTTGKPRRRRAMTSWPSPSASVMPARCARTVAPSAGATTRTTGLRRPRMSASPPSAAAGPTPVCCARTAPPSVGDRTPKAKHRRPKASSSST